MVYNYKFREFTISLNDFSMPLVSDHFTFEIVKLD